MLSSTCRSSIFKALCNTCTVAFFMSTTSGISGTLGSKIDSKFCTLCKSTLDGLVGFEIDSRCPDLSIFLVILGSELTRFLILFIAFRRLSLGCCTGLS